MREWEGVNKGEVRETEGIENRQERSESRCYKHGRAMEKGEGIGGQMA